VASGKVIRQEYATWFRTGELVTTISTAGAEYTVLYDGYLEGNLTASPGDGRIASVAVNNVMVGGVGGVSGSTLVHAVGFSAPVKAGDIVKTRTGIGSYNVNVYKFL